MARRPRVDPSKLPRRQRDPDEEDPPATRLSPLVKVAMAHDRARLRQAEEMIAHQRELQAAQARGDELVYSEAGTCISYDAGNVRPRALPEGGPLLRGGRWL